MSRIDCKRRDKTQPPELAVMAAARHGGCASKRPTRGIKKVSTVNQR